MRVCFLTPAFAALAFAASSASASVHTLTYTITNNTATPWQEVIFEVRPPRGVQYDPDQYALVHFMTDAGRHNTTKNPVDIYVEDQNQKVLHFDYSAYTPISANDGPVTFTLTIDNPSGMDFRVGYRKVLVPAPAGAAMGLAGLGLAAIRRRRAS